MAGATEQDGFTRSLAANGDLSAYQYFLVKRHTTEGQCVAVAATTDIPIGILQNKPAATGRAAEVKVLGLSKAQVEATSDISIGSKLGPNTDARLIIKSSNNDIVNAMAEQAATTATGDVITVTVFPPIWFGA